MRTFEGIWRERFERFAQRYKADHNVSGWSCSGLKRRLALFNELIKKQDLQVPTHILDLGCGAGTYVRFLTSLGHRVVGLDYSLPSLYRALSADKRRDGHYTGGEAYNLPFCNESFDLVVSIGILQVLECPERVFDEIFRVLRPNGLFIVEFLNTFEVVALMRSMHERLRGESPRVRTYSPFLIHHWLSQKNFRLVHRYGVYLSPRWFPWLEWILDRKGVSLLMERIPGLSLLSAHAFIIIGKK